jgi:hypothetical protein
MYGLDVERLLDFGVRSDEEMKEDQGWEEKSENRKCYKKKTVSLLVYQLGVLI